MLEKHKMLMDAETDLCIQVASDFLTLAEKELSAFIRAVDKLFGGEQARQSALDWIEELGHVDWPSGESIPDWRRATVGASARLGALSRPHRHDSEEIRSMNAIASTPIDAEAKNAPTSGRLFFLDLSGGRILSANPDGSDLKTIINEGRKLPDGLVLDVAAGHIYWTNMGDPNSNDGSIMRSELNGQNMITIVPPGGTFTPKQLQLEKRSGKLYWSDREGMRVMRVNLDGSQIETLVDTSSGDSRPGSDPRKWCVGIAVDTDGGKFYWTQKGGHHAGLGRIFRANIQVPPGQSAENRRDIELLYDNLPEPIDLDLDPVHRTLYWTDRGDPPRGNTVNRAPMDPEAENGKEPEILFTHLMEAIGLALDLKGGRMFITDLGGSVYSANLDGSNRMTLLFAEGNLTGIAYAEVPPADRGGASQVTGVPEETNMEDNTPVKLNGGIMSIATGTSLIRPEPGLLGQTVVVIGGSAGIGLETARRARAEGARLILAARNPERLEHASRELGPLSSMAFDATNFDQLKQFFDGLPARIDHVLVTGPGPYYAPLAELEIEKARRDVEAHLMLPLQVARYAAKKVRPGGTLLFMGGTGGRRAAPGLALVSALTAALPALTRDLALELAPVRVNLIAAGFVDTSLSASLLGDQLDARREQLRATLPIRRVVGPEDVAALAVHLMTNTALTGATYDIDGGQQLA
jgi:NAD(P)-dependent dehydrogenase (short-subunit alcohol dehydrogenase family)